MSTNLEKVPAHVLALAAKINEAITYDDDGQGTLPESFLADNLPEDVTVDSLKRHQEVELDFGDALVLGNGDKSKSHLQANKGIDRTTVSLNIGHDQLLASYDRKVMTRAPGSTEEKPKYGASNLKLVSGIGQKRGNFKRIQEHLVTEATSIFGQ